MDNHGASGFSLPRLVRTAVLLRLGLAVLLHVFVSETLFAPDQRSYHAIGERLARYWSDETLIPPAELVSPGPKAYYYIVGALYYVFGSLSLVPKLLNAMLGGLSILLVHDLALRITDNAAVAARAATYAAFFPSMLLWCVLNIRDAWVIVLILLICRQAMVLQDRFSFPALVLLAGSLIAVTLFRDYIFFAVATPMVVSFLVRSRRHLVRNVVVGMLVAAVVIYADQAAGSQRKLRTPDLEEIQTLRKWGSVGARSGFEEVDISTPGNALVFLPVGLAYFLLAPFPWSIAGIRQALTLPEMLFFYTLVPAILRGIYKLARERLSHALMVLLITAGLTFGYALGEGNAGTAYRHRAQVLCFYLVFAAVGIEAKRQLAAPPG